MTDPDMPRPTGATKEITLTGMLMPWVTHGDDGQPAWVLFPGDEHRYILLWSDVADLRNFMARFAAIAEAWRAEIRARIAAGDLERVRGT